MNPCGRPRHACGLHRHAGSLGVDVRPPELDFDSRSARNSAADHGSRSDHLDVPAVEAHDMDPHARRPHDRTAGGDGNAPLAVGAHIDAAFSGNVRRRDSHVIGGVGGRRDMYSVATRPPGDRSRCSDHRRSGGGPVRDVNSAPSTGHRRSRHRHPANCPVADDAVHDQDSRVVGAGAAALHFARQSDRDGAAA